MTGPGLLLLGPADTLKKPMRALLPLLLVVSTGCTTAKIETAFMSRDEEGIRKAVCFTPHTEQFFGIIELLSFREKTILTPVVVVEELAPGDEELVVPRIGVGTGSGELERFGNIAPGTGDHRIALRFQLPEDPPPPAGEPLTPWAKGVYRLDLYLNREFVNVDTDFPNRSIPFLIDQPGPNAPEECSCPPIGECPPPRVPQPLEDAGAGGTPGAGGMGGGSAGLGGMGGVAGAN